MSETSAPTAVATGRTLVVDFLLKYGLQVGVLVVFGILLALLPSLRNFSSIQSILLQSSFAGLIACGMTLLIVAGVIDLSVAGILTLSAVVVATILPYTTIGIAIAVGLGAGALLGLVNGLVVTKLRIPSFIATLGMLNLYLGAAFIWTQRLVKPIGSTYYRMIGTAKPLGIPLPFIFLVAVALICWLVLTKTPLGRNIRAVGSSEVAARMAGIRVDRVIIGTFTIAGVCTALAGVTLSAVLSSASGTMALGIELQAVAVAVVGGTALRGGEGTLLGTFTGAFLFAAMGSVLNLVRVPSYWQGIVVGGVLVVALAIGAHRRAATGRGGFL